MSNTNRLPRYLQRLAEIGIAIIAAMAIVLLATIAFSDASLETAMEFTPDEGTYSLTSSEWGTGTVHSSVGAVQFTDRNATLDALTSARVLAYAAAAIILLVLIRGVLQTVVAGVPFAKENADRIRAIGFLIPGFGLLIQGIQWAISNATMNTLVAEGLHIEARLALNLNYLFIGLVIVAMAEAFRHGTHLQTDADLTV